MPGPSRYPGFHKHVTKAYLIILSLLLVILPILNVTIKNPSIKNMIGVIVFVVISYIVYWLIVRLNCYGAPLTNGRNLTSNNNRNNNTSNNTNSNIYTQPPRSNSSTTSTRSSSNGGTNNQHPTFDNYRFGRFAEVFRRFGSSNSTSTTNDDEEIGEVLSPPPPTYNTALEGAGLPPPYMNDPVEINIHNSESPQMSERYVPPRRPVPSVPSSNSLRRPVPQVPQQQSSTQSTQYTSQDPSIISDSPRRPVPLIPTSQDPSIISDPPRRPVPLIPQSPGRPVRSVSNSS